MQIGTLSKRTGVSVRMLRYYEAEGLLQPARRDSGYRDYGEADEAIVRRIRILSDAGLKLTVIKRFLPCVTSERPDFHPCPALSAALRHEVSQLEQRIGSLEASRAFLASFLSDADRSQATVAKVRQPSAS